MNRAIRKDGKVVGTVKGCIYYTSRTEETIFQKYQSVNISQEVLDQLERMDVRRIEVTYTNPEGREIIYTTPLKRFLWARRYEYDGDIQNCLSLSDFEYNNSRQRGLDEFYGEGD